MICLQCSKTLFTRIGDKVLTTIRGKVKYKHNFKNKGKQNIEVKFINKYMNPTFM
jgi:hypothetical protein